MTDDAGVGPRTTRDTGQRASRPAPAPPSSPVGWLAAAGALLVEVALVGTLAVATHRLAGGGVAGWLWAAVATGALLALWGSWMAPRARWRLPLPGRLALGCGLVVLVAALAHPAGLTTWAWWFGATGVVLMVAGQSLQGR